MGSGTGVHVVSMLRHHLIGLSNFHATPPKVALRALQGLAKGGGPVEDLASTLENWKKESEGNTR